MLNLEEDLKGYYRFIEFTSKLVGIELPHERFKNIALNKYKVESKEEKQVNSLKDAYLYLMNNTKQVLTKEMLNKAYHLLTGVIMNKNLVNEILEEYYQNYDEDSFVLASNIHYLILKQKIERKIEFAFILTNYILKKFAKNLLIPYGYLKEDYEKVINNQTKDELIKALLKFEVAKVIKRNDYSFSKQEIIQKLKKYREIFKKNFW